MRVCFELDQLDESVWLERPLTPKVLDAACKDVRHLCQLRRVLLERRLGHMGLYTGIGFYINSLRQLDDEQYEDYDKLGVRCCWYFYASTTVRQCGRHCYHLVCLSMRQFVSLK